MNVEASNGRAKASVLDCCERLIMRSECADESRFLAMLHRAARFGGTVEVVLPERGDTPGRKLVMRFMDGLPL